jgi:putative transposase
MTNRMEACRVAISMDGRGWVIDNMFVEWLWRSGKSEEAYLREYVDGWEAVEQLAAYIRLCSHERPHHALA